MRSKREKGDEGEGRGGGEERVGREERGREREKQRERETDGGEERRERGREIATFKSHFSKTNPPLFVLLTNKVF